jgi:hypothetical protein
LSKKAANGLADRAAAPQETPAADLNKTRLHKIAFSTKWPPRTASVAQQPAYQSRALCGKIDIRQCSVLSVKSEIPSYSHAIFRIFLKVMLFQILFFAQYLAMEQPGTRTHIDQKNPIGAYQELAEQDKGEGCVNWIATEGKDAGGYELVGVFRINANPKTLPERNQAPKQEHQPCQAK